MTYSSLWSWGTICGWRSWCRTWASLAALSAAAASLPLPITSADVWSENLIFSKASRNVKVTFLPYWVRIDWSLFEIHRGKQCLITSHYLFPARLQSHALQDWQLSSAAVLHQQSLTEAATAYSAHLAKGEELCRFWFPKKAWMTFQMSFTGISNHLYNKL